MAFHSILKANFFLIDFVRDMYMEYLNKDEKRKKMTHVGLLGNKLIYTASLLKNHLILSQ